MSSSLLTAHHRSHIHLLRTATTVVWVSLFLLIGLTVIKSLGGYATNIIGFAGDALGSFSDIISTIAILIGLKLSQKKASTTFKYGYHRVETFISLCISIFVAYAGIKIFNTSLNRFFASASTQAHSVGILTAGVSILISGITFYYHKKVGTRLNSQAILASASDKLNDVFVSLGVLISVVADKYNIPYIEGVVGILTAIIAISFGVTHGKEAFFYLLDYWDNPEVTQKIRRILIKSKIVTGVKKIRLRHAGTYIFGEAFIEVNPFTDSKDLRDEIHRLNREIEKNVDYLGDLVLYIDPPKPTTIRVAIPISHEEGLHSKIASGTRGSHNFIFVDIKNGGIRKFYSHSQRVSLKDPVAMANFLKKEKTNILVTSFVNPLLYYNLRLNNIKVYPQFSDVKDVENTVKLLLLDI